MAAVFKDNLLFFEGLSGNLDLF